MKKQSLGMSCFLGTALALLANGTAVFANSAQEVVTHETAIENANDSLIIAQNRAIDTISGAWTATRNSHLVVIAVQQDDGTVVFHAIQNGDGGWTYTTGSVEGNTLTVSGAWNETATISSDFSSIQWASGNVWNRVPL